MRVWCIDGWWLSLIEIGSMKSSCSDNCSRLVVPDAPRSASFGARFPLARGIVNVVADGAALGQ